MTRDGQGSPDDATWIQVRRGSLYLSADVYERYFRGLDSVILIRKEGDLLVMPVRHAAAGGYILKVRNPAGDRVINAMDFFREHGVDETAAELELEAAWSTEDAALRARAAFEL